MPGNLAAILAFTVAASASAQDTALSAPPRPAIEVSGFRVEVVDLAFQDEQVGFLELRLTSTADTTVVAGLQYRIRVGGWSRDRTLGAGDIYAWTLEPGETRTVRARILVPGWSVDSRLTLAFGPAEPSDSRPGHGRVLAADTTWRQPLDNHPRAAEISGRFARAETSHVEVFGRTGMLSGDELREVALGSEAALRDIVALLDGEPPKRVRIVLYPDLFLKWIDTGHMGTGWAFDSTLVEVFGATDAMDPYHELVHLVANQGISPPPVFSEGLAIWAGERLGGPALRFLGRDQTVRQAVCDDLAVDTLFPLQEIIRFINIGSGGTRPRTAYPQAAAIVDLLVETHGLPGFMDRYHALAEVLSGDSHGPTDPVAATERAFGTTLPALEDAWSRYLRDSCPTGDP